MCIEHHLPLPLPTVPQPTEGSLTGVQSCQITPISPDDSPESPGTSIRLFFFHFTDPGVPHPSNGSKDLSSGSGGWGAGQVHTECVKLLKGDRWQVGGAERSSVQSLECHLVVPSSGEHPANLQALYISSPSLSPPGTIPVHSNCPFTQLFLLLVSKLLDAGTIAHYLGYPGRCQRLPNRHSPGGVSCFTGSAPRPSKQGVPPLHHLGPARTGQGTNVSTLTQHGSSPSVLSPIPMCCTSPAPVCGAACVGRQKLSCAVASSAGSVGSILPEPGQMWPDLASSICPGPQTSSLTAPAWPTRPGHSVPRPGVGGWEPGPATSPAGLGSFPASSHMTPVSVYFCLWPPCLQRPRATSSLICFTGCSPCAGPFPVASFQSMCCLWLALPARTPHPTPSTLYRCEAGSGYFFM